MSESGGFETLTSFAPQPPKSGRSSTTEAAYPGGKEPVRSTEEPAMADKSPRQHLSKKTGKSLKEKRAEKHAKADAKDAQGKIEILPPGKRR